MSHDSEPAEVHTDDDGLTPASDGSPLQTLRDRRAKLQQRLTTDLKVPRWDDDGGNPVYVRFRPLTQAEVTAAQKRSDKLRDKDAGVIVNAGLLATACVGVFEVIDDTEVSIDPEDRDGTWPRFDERLGDLLGVEQPRAAEVVRALYFTDGDLLATAAQLAEWSGYSNDELDREHAGN